MTILSLNHLIESMLEKAEALKVRTKQLQNTTEIIGVKRRINKKTIK